MRRILLDTNALLYLMSPSLGALPEAARNAIDGAEYVFISGISLFEIGQKVRVGKLPIAESVVRALPETAAQSGIHVVAVSPSVLLEASLLQWAHRDPFDRIIAATAKAENAGLVGSDGVLMRDADVLGLRGVIWG